MKSFTFPSCLKEVDVTPIHKKGKKDKGNYRPVSILPALSKIFEGIMFTQVSVFFEDIFNKQFSVKVVTHGNVCKKRWKNGNDQSMEPKFLLHY